MSAKHLVLAVLQRGPSHAYRVARALADLPDESRVEATRVHGAIAALVSDGLIVAAPVARAMPAGAGAAACRARGGTGNGAGARPPSRVRRTLALSPAGGAELDRWLAQPSPAGERLRQPLFARLAIEGPPAPARLPDLRRAIAARPTAAAAPAPGRAASAPGVPAAHEVHGAPAVHAVREARDAREARRVAIERRLLERWAALAGAVSPPPTSPPPLRVRASR